MPADSYIRLVVLLINSCLSTGLPTGPVPPAQEVHHAPEAGGVYRNHGNRASC